MLGSYYDDNADNLNDDDTDEDDDDVSANATSPWMYAVIAVGYHLRHLRRRRFVQHVVSSTPVLVSELQYTCTKRQDLFY